MEPRDRRANLALFAAAAVTWVAVGVVVLTRDPILEPTWGWIGAGLLGLAVGLTSVPLFWLARFARRRIAYRGDWLRAGRRGGWAGLLVATFVGLRLLDLFALPIALFITAMVVVAESTLSMER
jgi:hypothetical protein